MKRMRWFIILMILALAAAAFIFMLKKQGLPLKIKKGGITSVSGMLNQAKEAQASSDFAAAKTAYQKLLNEFSNSAEVSSWQKKIDDLNIKLLFSPVITANSALYETAVYSDDEKKAQQRIHEIIAANQSVSRARMK